MEEKKEGEKERGGSTKLKEEKGREVEWGREVLHCRGEGVDWILREGRKS